jgi:IS5 family transposase
MSRMNVITVVIDGAAPAVRPFTLLRERVLPALERRRADLEEMYAPVMGRPETDPILLMAATVLQIMLRLPDRACAEACRYEARWRLALGDIPPFHPTTLVNFRNRLNENGKARLALDASLEAMREAGYLKSCRAVRIDSTHLLARIAGMSRLECVRETLRLALAFLSAFGGVSTWEPWGSRYGDCNSEELCKASPEGLAVRMTAAGADARDVLARADALGEAVSGAEPVALLRRVLGEQFEIGDGAPVQKRAADAGAVVNPHDPEAQWSTKTTLGKEGWRGYKAQVCESVEDSPCAKGEPTKAVVTAILVQSATGSDHGSVPGVLAEHRCAVGSGRSPPDEVFVDAGYVSTPALLKAEGGGYALTGPMPAPPHSGSRFGTDSFAVDIPGRVAVCPAGQASSECDRIDDAKYAQYGTKYYFAWPAKTCAACPLRERCVSKKNKLARRTIEVSEHHMTVQARRELCKTPEYRNRMRKRNAVEGTHSELVRGYGLRRCRYKGRAKTGLQAQFTATACNLRRWARRLCWEERKKA